MAAVQNVDADDIRLWPLGNFVVPSGTNRSNDNLPVALAGLVTSGTLAVTSRWDETMEGTPPFSSRVTVEAASRSGVSAICIAIAIKMLLVRA